MNKSYVNENPRIQYALDHSTPLNKYIEELIEISLKQPDGLMTGAKGVLQTCLAVIEMIQAKNVLDVGLFTGSGVGNKIDIRIQPALKTLQGLIDDGQSGKFDFAFLDANKTEYPEYYVLCMQLLPPGGVIAVDNALWGDTVFKKDMDAATAAVDKLNK